MGDTWPKVAIIVLNWNGWQDTIECLESLQRITYHNYQIIVVDNGSTDGSVERIKAWARGEIPMKSKFFEYDSSTKSVQWIEYDRATAEAGGIAEEEAKIARPPNRRIVLIQTGENLGFTGGNNLGIRYAWKRGAEYFWILNNDTVVAPDALIALVKVANDDSSIGITGSRMLNYQYLEQQSNSGGVIQPWKGAVGGSLKSFNSNNDQWLEMDYVSGSSMLVNRMAVKAVGLLDERYFLYTEEADWCMRMKRREWKVVSVPSSKVWHKVSRATGCGSPMMYYYMTRNQLLFFTQYFPLALPFALIRAILRMVKLLILRRWAQLKTAFRGCLDWGRGRYGALKQNSIKYR